MMNISHVILLAAALAPDVVAAASGITSGGYQQVCGSTYGGCGPLGGISGDVPSWDITTPHYTYSFDYQPFPAVPAETFAADTQLIASLSPGHLHAYATSGATLTNPQTGLSPGAFVRGFSTLSVTAYDNVHFNSSTLPSGADVSFQLTGVLHSIIAADQTGNCALGAAAYAYAEMNLQAGSFQFAPGTFKHTSCGEGSDLMTATQTFHATVGGPAFGIVTAFSMAAEAELQVGFTTSLSTSVRQTVDASNTASIVINVLTPGVALQSDSGYPYTPLPVPEPGSYWLMAWGLAALAGRLRCRA
jgi:hypothetical protein